MIKVPQIIVDYLNKLGAKADIAGYLCLDDAEGIVSGDGHIGKFEISQLDRDKDLVQSVPFLEGLLPSNTKTDTIIRNVHLDDSRYFDIHLFSLEANYWILFIDTTQSGNELQHEQQLRLNVDFDNDKRKTGS